MPILDFLEIPPATAPSSDTEAFEKFAKDFFIQLRGAYILKTVGRGPDGGADLLLGVGKEKWLVSCKHYTSGEYIPPGKEEDPAGRIKQWGCQKFIGFYSPGPTSGLEQKLRQTYDNTPLFSYEILDSGDIEREMVATASSAGWILAFRWFPKSFSQIATSLVAPLTVYSDSSIVQTGGYIKIPGLSLSAQYPLGDEVSAQFAREVITELANESETAKAFSGIFFARVKDFAQLVPKAFSKLVHVDNAQLTVHDVFPSWDLGLIRYLSANKNRHGLRNLCRMWSLWDINFARSAYQYGELLLRYTDHKAVRLLDDVVSIRVLADRIKRMPVAKNIFVLVALDSLTFGEMGREGYTVERGYFAALLCFNPGSLRASVKSSFGIAALAEKYGEDQDLQEAVFRFANTFSDDDQEYVWQKSPTLEALLESVEFIQLDALDELKQLNPTLRCLSEPLVERWSPEGDAPSFLGKALGFST